MYLARTLAISVVALALSACGDSATLAVVDGTGSQPVLPAPNKTLIPTVHVAKASLMSWSAHSMP